MTDTERLVAIVKLILEAENPAMLGDDLGSEAAHYGGALYDFVAEAWEAMGK